MTGVILEPGKIICKKIKECIAFGINCQECPARDVHKLQSFLKIYTSTDNMPDAVTEIWELYLMNEMKQTNLPL